jgi:hypothetical protein
MICWARFFRGFVLESDRYACFPWSSAVSELRHSAQGRLIAVVAAQARPRSAAAPVERHLKSSVQPGVATPRVVLGGVSDEIPSLVRRNQCRVAARVKCVKCCNGHWLEQGDAVTPQRCPADDAGPLSHGSTQPDLRKRHGSQYAGQRRVRTGLGVQSDRQSRFGLCRSATAEFAEYGERVAIRRRLRASALGTHPVRARCGAFARACAAPPAAAGAETKEVAAENGNP